MLPDIDVQRSLVPLMLVIGEHAAKGDHEENDDEDQILAGHGHLHDDGDRGTIIPRFRFRPMGFTEPVAGRMN